MGVSDVTSEREVTVDPTSGWKLAVVEGVHAGGEHLLPDGVYVVGSDLGCDIVLFDEGVLAQHVRLHVEGRRARAQRLNNAPLMLNGNEASGETAVLASGDVLRVGGGAFSLTAFGTAAAPSPETQAAIAAARAAAARHTVQPGIRWTMMVPIIAVLAVLATAFTHRERPAAFTTKGASTTPPPDVEMQIKKLGQGQATPPEKRDELVIRVREFIGDENLAVDRDAKGRVVISGSTRAKNAHQQVQRIQKEYTGSVEIIDKVAYVNDSTPRQIRMPQRITDIHVGDIRWFRTADGARYFEGSQFEDGAEVVKIDMDNIVFRHHGRLVVFSSIN